MWDIAWILMVLTIAYCFWGIVRSAFHGTPLNRPSFKERWPAISDDEFVARCTPGTRRTTALKVRRIVSEQLGIPYEHIYPEQHFFDDLDCC